MEDMKFLTSRQRELLRLINPLEYGFNQHEASMVMGITERQVNRIFRQFKKDFPDASKQFIKLKKATKRLGRHLKNPWVLESGDCGEDSLYFGRKIVRIWK
jgi:hypothetical protein